MEEIIFEGMKYLISYPNGFREDQKYPLVIYLHGAGSRSESTEALRKRSTTQQFLKWQEEKEYVFLAPLCHCGNWYECMSTLVQLVKTYRESPYIDETRIHLTGNSMGGYGTWALVTLHANWFASAMPVCGGGIPGFAMNLIHLPIRAFHGLQDKTVDPIESLQMAKAVNRYGGHAELILYPECAHNCWDAAYADEKNIDWLLSYTAPQDGSQVEDISRTIYGRGKKKSNF